MPLDLATDPEARPNRPRWRIGLAPSMALIAVLSIALAAMKIASVWLGRGVIVMTAFALLIATLGAIVRRRRASWIGVALFGWGYVLFILGQPFLSAVIDNNDEHSGIWQVDGLIRGFAAQLHPEPPEPVDSFPRIRVNLNSAPGRHTKQIDGVMVPFTPEDYKLQADYEARTIFFEGRVKAVYHARVIGLAFQGMAFALIGGAAGHVLSDRSTPADMPYATRTSTRRPDR